MEWIVGGFIVGPRLPDAEMRIGAAEIRPTQEGERFAHFKPRNVEMSFEGVDAFRSVVYGRQTVHSQWIIRFWVEAANAQEAFEMVDQQQLPPVQAALELAFDARYFIDLHVIVPADGSLPQVSPYVQSGPGDPFDPGPMSPDEIAEAQHLLDGMRRRPTFLQAAHLLSDSGLVEDVSNEGRVQRFALLGLFQVIENVANEVAKDLAAPKDHLAEQETLISRLTASLAKKQGVNKRVARVRQVAEELNRLDGVFLAQRLRRSGEELAIPTQDIETAIELSKLRNTKLGHRGDVISADHLRAWLHDARQVARSYLTSYAKWLVDKKS